MNEVLSGVVPFGTAGLGQHFAQRVLDAHDAGKLLRYFVKELGEGAPAGGEEVADALFPVAARLPPLRFSAGRKAQFESDRFDRHVAKLLPAAAEHFVGFPGQALATMGAAKSIGCVTELHSAGTHFTHVARVQREVLMRYPWDRGWLSSGQQRKAVLEYAMADRIMVTSEHTRQTFVEAGVAEEKLERYALRVDSRFAPLPSSRARNSHFEIVYVGTLSAMKGIPVLAEAFSHIASNDARLRLVGGASTRPMRRWLDRLAADDSRIVVGPADPLPIYQRASVYVHPSFDDGWGYAPMEALACGLPAVVTTATGMKDDIGSASEAWVVEPGDVDAIVDRLHQLGVR